MLDGRARHEEIVAEAIKNGNPAVALTDHDEVNGQIRMQQLCEAAGIKFIHGTEARFLRESTAVSRANKTSGNDNSHIVLLAANDEGLRNMWTLSSLAYEPENFYGKPQLNPSLLKQYSSGLWASDGCGLTRFAGYIEKDLWDEARQEWALLLEIFGDHFYSELHTFQFIETPDRPLNANELQINAKITKMNQAKVAFAQEMSVPLVVVNDAHYAPEEHWEQHRLVWQMGKKRNKADQSEGDAHAADWMMSNDDLVYWMERHEIPRSVIDEAISNTVWIADQCNAVIKPTITMPRLHETDEDDAKAFAKSCEEGLQKFILSKGLPEDVYRARLEREMKLIVDQGMPGYFNVVADYVMKARDGSYIKWLPGKGGSKPSPCLCGPGRGSGGGSLVNYVLGITSIDPVYHDLSFERFINPDRPDYPDIDVDFQKSHRKGLIGYMGARYGEDKVVAIGTKSKSGPAKTLQDLCKVMEIPFKESVAMSKLIKTVDFSDDHDYDVEPDYEPPSWAEVIEKIGGELAPWVEAYPELFQRVEQMVGLVRQPGVHAAGIVVSTTPILGNIPTRRKGGKIESPITTQFDMEEVAWLGGVKDDFLSNKGLDVLAMAREMIYERHGVWIDYDGFGNGIPEGAELITMGEEYYSDPAIWDQIDKGLTAGIFQINTASGTKQAQNFRPRNLQDLADLVAVNRPGVLHVKGLLQSYLARRHGEEDVTYDHPLLERILERTNGILVYQEDLVEATKLLAGFTPGQGETLRKAIGKKKLDLMQSFEQLFYDGCMANPEFTRHGNRGTAEKIWRSLLASASYAFNKAHSIGYAMQAIWEIWTKHYYYDEFICACMNVHDPDKLNRFIRECRRLKKTIVGPDVNRSAAGFTIDGDALRFGLADIKGIGDASMPDILDKQPFVDFGDYLDRCSTDGGLKKGVVDNLVKIGAFDWTGQDRQAMLEQVYRHRRSLEAPVMWSKMTHEEREKNIREKRAAKPENYPVYTFNSSTISEIEEELVGTFITHDPMGAYINMIENVCIQSPSEMEEFDTGERFVIGGIVTRLHTHMQKNQKQMCFITIQWAEQDFEFLAFADSWSANKPMMKVGVPVACEVIKLNGGGANLSTVERLDWLTEE